MRKPYTDEEFEKLGPKERLECLKIENDIRDQQRRWYTRTGFWLSATPAIIAVIGAVIGVLLSIYNGWFDASSRLLEVSRAELRMNNTRLQGERDSLNRSVARLHQDSIRLTSSFKDDSTDLRRRYEVLRSQDSVRFAIQTAVSQNVLDSLSVAKTYLEVKIADLQFENSVAPVAKTLQRFLADSVPSTDGFEIGWLVNALRTNDSLRSRTEIAVANAVKQPTDDIHRASLLCALYVGTGNREWFDKILAMIDDHPSQSEFYKIFDSAILDSADKSTMDRRLVAAVSSDPEFCGGASYPALIRAYRTTNFDSMMSNPSERNAYLEGIRLYRDCILSPGRSRETAISGLLLLKQYDPDVCAFLLSELIFRTNDAKAQKEIASHFDDLRKYALPSVVLTDWIDGWNGEGDLRRHRQDNVAFWLSFRHANKGRVDLWTESDLRQIRNQPELFKKAEHRRGLVKSW